MPMRQIGKRFTRSEMALMAWRNAEMSSNWQSHRRAQANDAARRAPAVDYTGYKQVPGGENEDVEHKLVVLGERLEPIIHKMVNERGEIDLRRLTGPEALRYMAALGIPIGGRVLR